MEQELIKKIVDCVHDHTVITRLPTKTLSGRPTVTFSLQQQHQLYKEINQLLKEAQHEK